MDSLTSNVTKLPPSSLIWSNVSVIHHRKPTSKNDTGDYKLLNNISGIAQSGEIFAIMGASGVGKTTLLRVLSGRISRQLELTGKIYLNGFETSQNQRTHSGLIGHVEQEELFVDTMTLEEHLIFQAMLRMPDKVPDDERRRRVNEIIIQLVLIKSRGTMIGRLSGGEKKRLAFATALLTNPNVLLVDEPTSGLDTYLAKSLMNIIRLMAIERNQTIIVILHQPTDTMFDLIDKLYVIVEGGRPAFFGNKNEAIDFFTNQCDMSALSLDGFIEQLAAPPDTLTKEELNIQKKTADQYSNSDNFKKVQTTIDNYTNLNDENNLKNKLDKIQRGSFFRQLKWLLWRSVAGGRRNPKRTTKLVVRLIVMAIIIGVTFLNLTSAPISYIEKTNSLLAVSFMSLLESNMNLILVEIPTERELVMWEYRRQLYSIGAYYITRLIVDTMYNLITAIINMGIIMLFAGLPHWFGIICVMILVLMTACSFAVFIASISSTPRTALLTLQPTQNIFANLIGFYINLESIPKWIRWLKYFSYLYYGYKLLLTVQWLNVDANIPCKYFSLNSTSNSSLFSYETCPKVGNEILKCFDVSSTDYYYDIIALFIMFAGYHILAYVIMLIRTKYDR